MYRHRAQSVLRNVCKDLDWVKLGFHRPSKPADERQKSADLWDFAKIFGRCNRLAKSAD